MADMHEATFIWPEVDAKNVIITGTFDQWSSSIHMTKTPRGFVETIKLPWGDRVLFKFVVDGRWLTAQSQPEEMDNSGNLNNVYECPSKPAPPVVETPPADLPPETVEPKHNELAEASVATSLSSYPAEQPTLSEKAAQVSGQIKERVVTTAQAVLPQGNSAAFDWIHAPIPTPVAEAAHGITSDTGVIEQVKESLPPTVTDTAQKLVETSKDVTSQAQAAIAPVVAPALQSTRDSATEKTPESVQERLDATADTVNGKGSGALAFVGSNLGTAIHALTGIDPINSDKIPVATPTPTRDFFEISSSEDTAPDTIPPQSFSDFSGPAPPDAAPIVTISAPSMVADELKAETPAHSLETPAGTDVVAQSNHKDTPDLLAETTNRPAPFNDIVVSEPPKAESASTIVTEAEPTAISESIHIKEAATITQTSAAVDPSATNLPPVTNTKAETPRLETKPFEQAASPTDAVSQPEIKGVTGAPAPLDTPATIGANSVIESVQRATADTTRTSNPTLSPIVAEKQSANGHLPAATGPTTPPKKPVTSESSNPQAFPTSESKSSTSAMSSPAASSKFGSARKKRVSIFGKVKNLFTHNKEEKEKN